MKNFEKWEEKLRNICTNSSNFGVVNGEPKPCVSILCDKECELSRFRSGDDRLCSAKRIDWLYREDTDGILLTQKEKQFVNLMGASLYLARERNGTLYLYDSKPWKHSYGWSGLSANMCMSEFEGLDFSFIKYEDEAPWDIVRLSALKVEE